MINRFGVPNRVLGGCASASSGHILIDPSGKTIRPPVETLNLAMEEHRQGRRDNGQSEIRIQGVVAAFERLLSTSDQTVTAEAVGKLMGLSKPGAMIWIRKAVANGLVHFAGRANGGWKLGSFDDAVAPVEKADVRTLHRSITETADLVRELTNGKPASMEQLIERIGITRDGVRYRLKKAEAAGLILSAGYLKGWVPAD